jgi:hypothetical protein
MLVDVERLLLPDMIFFQAFFMCFIWCGVHPGKKGGIR